LRFSRLILPKARIEDIPADSNRPESLDVSARSTASCDSGASESSESASVEVEAEVEAASKEVASPTPGAVAAVVAPLVAAVAAVIVAAVAAVIVALVLAIVLTAPCSSTSTVEVGSSVCTAELGPLEAGAGVSSRVGRERRRFSRDAWDE
jgi:hypothetical protein